MTQAIFLLIAAITLVEWIRHRDRPRLDIALMFGSLAAIVLVQGIQMAAHLSAAWLRDLGTIAFLTQPYLLLRLVLHFRPVPRYVQGVAIAAMLGSSVLVVVLPAPLPAAATLLIVAYYAYVEGYSVVAFVAGARATGGVTHWRLLLAATGSALLAAIILFAGLGTLVPMPGEVIAVAAGLLATLCAASYYCAFAPPGWLRRAWQLPELQKYLQQTAGRAVTDRADQALAQLCPAATRALGAAAALAALWDESAGQLVIRASTGHLPSAGTLEAADGPIAAAWSGRTARIAHRPAALGASGAELAASVGAEGILAVPIASAERARGLLIVFLRQGLLFAEDDAKLLELLTEQSALALGYADVLAEQRALVERLRETNAELERATRLKSQFLANMSHELRTPLNAIIGFSELLLDDPENAFPAATRGAYLETIFSSGKHLLALINDVLDLAKVEAGKMELHLEAVETGPLIDQVVATLDPLATRKGLALLARDGTGDRLVADAGKLKQILYNLLSNAIKFTPEGGQVTVLTRHLPDAVQFTVADTGIGIAPDDQARIFDEFQQLDAGAERRYEGTGLGLALTRRFVAMHGGRIWVESAPGQGSRFHVVIPRQPLPTAAPPAEDGLLSVAAAPAAADRPLVLVVEDDPRAANLLSLYLARGGYRTEVATDGEQALSKARELQPCAIALDILLPKIDGWEVLRALKLDDRTRDVPVVVVSVVDDEQLGYALGAVDYFVKPVDRQALLARLGRYAFTTIVKAREVRILVVDDEPAAVELLGGILAPVGFTVLRASGGAEAIRLAEQERPDLVLLDLMMPEVSGFDVVSALSANPETRDIPILVITAKELTEDDKAALNGHVSAVLRKGAGASVELLAWLADSTRRLAARRIA